MTHRVSILLLSAGLAGCRVAPEASEVLLQDSGLKEVRVLAKGLE